MWQTFPGDWFFYPFIIEWDLFFQINLEVTALSYGPELSEGRGLLGGAQDWLSFRDSYPEFLELLSTILSFLWNREWKLFFEEIKGGSLSPRCLSASEEEEMGES